ncbi:MAG: ABC transporter permease, partial [Methylococcaceae bacterium]|nr:ABC transporter permease [Methylococcaceae bacterium]
LGAAIFHTLVSLIVWLVFYLILFGLPNLTALLFPVVLLPLLLFTLGISWFLASLGVYLRDVGQFIGIITTALLFLSPIFYPITALPEGYRPLVLVNPVALVIEQARGVLIWGQPPDWLSYGGYFTGSLLIAWLGFAWFQKTRKGFADVL